MDFRLYTADRSYLDFILLQNELSILLIDTDYAKFIYKMLDLPSPSFDQNKFVDSLEKYLQGIIQNPSYINSNVLKFLNVLPEDQIPFIKYQDTLLRSKTSILKQKTPAMNVTRTESNNSKNEDICCSLTASPNRIFLTFEIACLCWRRIGEAGEDKIVQFEFQLTNTNKRPIQVWRIYKSFSDVKNFHTELENQFQRQINLFNELVPRASNYNLLSDEFLDQRKKGLEKYMQTILLSRNYCTNLLYEFLEFDQENEKPVSMDKVNERYSLCRSDVKGLTDTFNFVFEEDHEELVLDLSRATPRHLKVVKHQKKNNDSWSPYFKSTFFYLFFKMFNFFEFSLFLRKFIIFQKIHHF